MKNEKLEIIQNDSGNLQKSWFWILLCCLLFCCESIFAQDFKTLQDGIEYAQITRQVKVKEAETTPTIVNLLRLDLTKVRLDVVHALDEAVGIEPTSSIATRHGAFAAINAGFFKLDGVYKGDAAGILQIDGKLLSESYGNRIALGILNGKDKTEVDFGHLDTQSLAGFGVDSSFAFSGINRERKDDEVILYTPEFHRTTLTNSTGTEIILGKCARRCEHATVVEGKGSSRIPPDGFVLSIGKMAKAKSNNIIYFAKNDNERLIEKIGIVLKAESIEKDKKVSFSKAEDIVGGVPQLIKNGKIEITWEQEKIGKVFVDTHHPRTAVAKLKDGKFLMITVDGRSEASGGMSLYELAEMLLEFGATDAMNLDGGGSTTMFVDGKVVNKPSDKEGERSVSDAILVFPRKSK